MGVYRVSYTSVYDGEMGVDVYCDELIAREQAKHHARNSYLIVTVEREDEFGDYELVWKN